VHLNSERPKQRASNNKTYETIGKQLSVRFFVVLIKNHSCDYKVAWNNYCSIVIVKHDAKVMTIEPASDAFMIKSVFLSERLAEIKRLGTYVQTARKSLFKQSSQQKM